MGGGGGQAEADIGGGGSSKRGRPNLVQTLLSIQFLEHGKNHD